METRPMNWGDNVNLVGAIQRDGCVTLSMQWRAMNRVAFSAWVQRSLAPRLRPGDIVLLDNLTAHKAPRVQWLIERPGVTLKPLPPYPPDFNPIEPAWSLVKRRIRDYVPGTPHGLRRVARTARHIVTPYHCHQFFAHAGYGNSITFRD